MSKRNDNILTSPIEYLKGVGPQRGEILRKELQVATFGDLLYHYPYRYFDRTQLSKIKDINPASPDYVQIA